MRIKLSVLILSVFYCLGGYAQCEDEDDGHVHHEHHRHEIGVSNAPVYYMKEKEISYGLHLHYVYNLPNTKFGIGFGYERIFDDHQHQTYGVVANYRPGERLSFNVAPGITFEAAEDHALFTVHVEAAYEYQVGSFHIGPAAEVAYDPEDIHMSIGLHLGYGF